MLIYVISYDNVSNIPPCPTYIRKRPESISIIHSLPWSVLSVLVIVFLYSVEFLYPQNFGVRCCPGL